MKAIIKRFLRENNGVTAIEYGLIAGLIAVAILAGASTIGTNLGNMFTNLGACLTTPSGTNCTAASIFK
ncbi:Flp family type IVb pilin [Burkholderia sp. S-53]|uniref:Flp family type IVb pilin n=1 Tax=Burkholderia sp. S-53 TaxID=2906514 RepID=UPI0021D2B684|nr:Flp family type IVb pilin [Burkholderia sp. S-53]UXU89285.1 Flp family type IVb pilin [Burkholderia sp. S-53]